MAARRMRWTRAQAGRVVDDLHRSGLTLAEFARTRDLHPKRIGVWRRRFEEEAAVEAPRMVELVATPSPAPCSLELRCPSGHVLQVTGVELTDGVRPLLAALPESKTCRSTPSRQDPRRTRVRGSEHLAPHRLHRRVEVRVHHVDRERPPGRPRRPVPFRVP